MRVKHRSLLDQYPQLHLIELNKYLEDNQKSKNILLYSDNWSDGEILEIAAHGDIHSFLNSNNKNFEGDLQTALKVHNNPRQLLENPLPLLFIEYPKVLILPFLKKEDKAQLLAQIEPFLQLTGSLIVYEHTRILFEELFMNAVFDAPSEFKRLGLKSRIKHCEFILAYDKENLVISCFDSYGSLNPINLVTRMRDIQNQGTKNIINLGQRKGGAGIGCSLLYRYSSTMSIVVDKGVGTRVTCSIPLKISQKNFYSLGKNLQYFNLSTQGGSSGK